MLDEREIRMKKWTAFIMAIVFVLTGVFSMELPSLAAGGTQVIITNQECSIWSAPNTSEQYRVKKVPAGYQITVYKDVVQSTRGDGKTFYKTLKGAYILCKYCSGSASPNSSAKVEDNFQLQSSDNTLLDASIRQLLNYLYKPGMSKDQLLKESYNYLVMNGSYDSMASFYYDYTTFYASGYSDAEMASAYCFLKGYKGDCYDFSNAFMVIALTLGYNAYAVRGVCASSSSATGWTNHGWCCIYDEATDTEYLYDPQIDNRVMTNSKNKTNTYCRYKKTYAQVKGKYMQYDSAAMLALFGDPTYHPFILYVPYQATSCDQSYDNRKVIYM